MVRAYYIESGLEVPLTDLERLGVEYLHLDSAAYIAGSLPALEQLCASRHYKNRDEIRCDLAAAKTPDTAPAFEAMLSNFFTEYVGHAATNHDQCADQPCARLATDICTRTRRFASCSRAAASSTSRTRPTPGSASTS